MTQQNDPYAIVAHPDVIGRIRDWEHTTLADIDPRAPTGRTDPYVYATTSSYTTNIAGTTTASGGTGGGTTYSQLAAAAIAGADRIRFGGPAPKHYNVRDDFNI